MLDLPCSSFATKVFQQIVLHIFIVRKYLILDKERVNKFVFYSNYNKARFLFKTFRVMLQSVPAIGNSTVA